MKAMRRFLPALSFLLATVPATATEVERTQGSWYGQVEAVRTLSQVTIWISTDRIGREGLRVVYEGDRDCRIVGKLTGIDLDFRQFTFTESNCPHVPDRHTHLYHLDVRLNGDSTLSYWLVGGRQEIESGTLVYRPRLLVPPVIEDLIDQITSF